MEESEKKSQKEFAYMIKNMEGFFYHVGSRTFRKDMFSATHVTKKEYLQLVIEDNSKLSDCKVVQVEITFQEK